MTNVTFNFDIFAQTMGQWLDLLGLLIMVGGIVAATAYVAVLALRRGRPHAIYSAYRQNLSRSILIGLEFLLAGDIIRTVAGDLSFDGVLILGCIVLIRLVLGLNLEMEIEGRWPWQGIQKK